MHGLGLSNVAALLLLVFALVGFTLAPEVWTRVALVTWLVAVMARACERSALHLLAAALLVAAALLISAALLVAAQLVAAFVFLELRMQSPALLVVMALPVAVRAKQQMLVLRVFAHVRLLAQTDFLDELR